MKHYQVDWFLSRVVSTNSVLLCMIITWYTNKNMSFINMILTSIMVVMLYDIIVMIIVYISNKLLPDDTSFDNKTIITGTIIYRQKDIE